MSQLHNTLVRYGSRRKFGLNWNLILDFVFSSFPILLLRCSKLDDWDSADEEDPLAPSGGAPPPGNSRFARVVVLKHMFTLKELEEDPSLALDLKEDVREEAESIGTVTNVVLYDVSVFVVRLDAACLSCLIWICAN